PRTAPARHIEDFTRNEKADRDSPDAQPAARSDHRGACKPDRKSQRSCAAPTEEGRPTPDAEAPQNDPRAVHTPPQPRRPASRPKGKSSEARSNRAPNLLA